MRKNKKKMTQRKKSVKLINKKERNVKEETPILSFLWGYLGHYN